MNLNAQIKTRESAGSTRASAEQPAGEADPHVSPCSAASTLTGAAQGFRVTWTRALSWCAVLTFAASAMAEDLPAPLRPPASYKAECGSCHTAFSPALLSAPDWRRAMDSLGKHFGTDARLDPKTHEAIRRFLERNAGSRARSVGAGDPPRITATTWFMREHREVQARLWKDPRVKSSANCNACHRGAEAGRFSENELALPELRGRED
jgi:mono/diheme cytochrome c family protein